MMVKTLKVMAIPCERKGYGEFSALLLNVTCKICLEWQVSCLLGGDHRDMERDLDKKTSH